jgi:hypothetical protein
MLTFYVHIYFFLNWINISSFCPQTLKKNYTIHSDELTREKYVVGLSVDQNSVTDSFILAGLLYVSAPWAGQVQILTWLYKWFLG